MGAEVFHHLGRVLEQEGLSTTVGDEGGFAPNMESNAEAVKLVLKAIEWAGYRPGEDFYLALDVAASELFREGHYVLRGLNYMSSEELIDMYASWLDLYPICSIEDGLAEDDWDGWARMSRELGHRVQLVGDDLFVTRAGPVATGHRFRRSQLHTHQAESDRDPDRDARNHRSGSREWFTVGSSRIVRAKRRTLS